MDAQTGYTIERTEVLSEQTVRHTVKSYGPDGYTFYVDESTTFLGTLFVAPRRYGYHKTMGAAVSEAMTY